MSGIDRNAKDPLRLRRNQQRLRGGGATATISVTAPLKNSGAAVFLNLDSAGGLESASQALRVKTRDTSFTRDASGVGVALRTNSGLQIASGLGVLLTSNPGLQLTGTGLGILLNGTTLLLGASGLSINAGGVGLTQLGALTTKGDLLTFSTTHARQPVGTNGQVLGADSAQTNGIRWFSQIWAETPSGTQNSVNVTFTLANTPIAGTVRIYKNGLRLKAGTDFTMSGATITYTVAPAPADVIQADYTS